MEAYIITILQIFIPLAIALFVWIIKKIYNTESKVKLHDSDIADLKQNQKEEIKDLKVKIDGIADKLTELCISFAKFTGYMERFNEENNNSNNKKE